MNIKSILSRLAISVIAIALSVNTAKASMNTGENVHLANRCFNGEGVNKDPQMAVNLLYERLEDYGVAAYERRKIYGRLARCHIIGEGGPGNTFMAAIYWIKSALPLPSPLQNLLT